MDEMKNMLFSVELLVALVAFLIGLEKKDRFIPRLFGVVVADVLGIGLCFGGSHSLFGYIFERYGYTVWTMVGAFSLIFLLYIFLVWMPFRVSFQEAVYCVTCAYLTEHIAYCIRILVNALTGTQIADAVGVLYILIHVGVCLLSYVMFARKMIAGGHYATSALRSIGLMLAVLFLVLGMSAAASIYGFATVHGIYALLCCIAVLYGQLEQQNQLRTQKELNLQQQLWMRHRAQYEMSKETIDIINRKCHDLKHQVAALRTIDNLEKRADVLDSIEDSVMIYDSILKTGNTILDTVLTEKGLICSQQHIGMTCIADGHLLDFMDAVDLYTLMGNAMDNAIEAVKRLPEEERFISIGLHEKVGLVLLQVENRYEGELAMADGFPVTTKEDKNYHGFGVKSIVQTAEKYHGFVTIETECQIFLLRITFPTKK